MNIERGRRIRAKRNNIYYANYKTVTRLRNELREKEEKIKKIIDYEMELKKQSQALYYSPVSIIVTDKYGKIEYVNPAFLEITKFLKEEVMGQNPSIQASGEMPKSFYKNLWSTILSGKVWHGTFVNKKKNGELYWEDAFISPIFNSKNEITNFVAVKEDITERKKAQEILLSAKLEAERANKVKSTFIAHMSHEIRTPLNAILGFSKLLISDPQINSNQTEKLKIIKQNGEHLLEMINEILEVSKMEATKTELHINSFNLHKFIYDLDNTFYLRAEEKKLNLEFIISGGVPEYVKTDEVKLRQILINLIANALKFTREGKITTRVYIKKINDTTNLFFSVKDTGIGIQEEDRERIFEKFVQVKNENYLEGGTGLGLAITKELVNKLGGEITVTSELGIGSEFEFYISFEVVEQDKAALKDSSWNNSMNKICPIDANSQLSSLSNDIKEKLKNAVLDGDIEEINSLSDDMKEEDKNLIKGLADKFEYERLLKLIEKC